MPIDKYGRAPEHIYSFAGTGNVNQISHPAGGAPNLDKFRSGGTKANQSTAYGMFSNTLGNPGTGAYATFGGQDAVEMKNNQK